MSYTLSYTCRRSVCCPFPILFRISRYNRRRPVWGRSCHWDRQHTIRRQCTAFLQSRRMPVSLASCIHRGDRWKRLLRLRYRRWDRSCRRNRKRVEICPGIFGVWACRYLVHPLLCTARCRNRSTAVRQDTVSPGFRHRLMAERVQWAYRLRSIQHCRRFLSWDVWNAVAGRKQQISSESNKSLLLRITTTPPRGG